MNDVLVEKLTSRKFWAYVVSVGAAIAFAADLIDQTGLTAIIAASGAYQIAEGLADFGQGRAQVAASSAQHELDRLLED